MNALLLLCLFPLVWPFIAKQIWNSEINYQEMVLQMVLVTLMVVGVWQAGKWSQTSDTEVWNGHIASKSRVHGTYEDPYDCRCSTDSKGNTSCSTCYETRYTVDWSAISTVGKINFRHLDTSSRFVYKTPDPTSYANCKVGEPASIEHGYKNWIQAVPNSLFHDDSKLAEQYVGMIPAYPRVYDFYRYNRVINVGSITDAGRIDEINTQLNTTLKSLGATKQVNIIVILTNILDPTYRFAIENAWLGAEKNDVVVLMGLEGDTVKWADVMTWALNSGNELFQISLQKKLAKLDSINNPEFTSIITDAIIKHYDRPHMEDYDYLAEEVTPADWIIYLAAALSFLGPIVLTFVFRMYDVDFFKNKGYNRHRRFK